MHDNISRPTAEHLLMDQQGQTLSYFRRHASDWQCKAIVPEHEYNLIEARNSAVLTTLSTLGKADRLLDVGCGTGQLVIDAARRGVAAAYGIDFAPEMIAQCEVNRSAAGVNARFDTVSFFDFKPPQEPYDIVSAQGFIEYISIEAMEDFFKRAAAMLRDSGALVIGSRNRLYNAVSMNHFTEMERKIGVLGMLTAEAIAIQASGSQQEVFEALRPFHRIHAHPAQHPDTGIGVALRCQFTPAELVGRLREHGFSPVTLYPIHFHALPPNVKEKFPAVHHETAIRLQQLAPLEHRLVPFCSSFVLEVRKHA
jgi:cyclopropane fatty-acyl-phospholipid synthase-like methyltransferase